VTVSNFVSAVFTPSAIVAAIPLIRFGLELAIERFLRRFAPDVFTLIHRDTRLGESRKAGGGRPAKALLAEATAFEIYRDYAEKVQRILQAGATAVLSVLLSQLEHGPSLPVATLCHSCHFLLLVGTVWFVAWFFWKLRKKRFDPAIQGSVDCYYKASLWVSLAVVGLEVLLKLSPHLCPDV